MAEPVIDAIIDQEVATMKHMERVIGRLDVTRKRLRQLARKIYDLRVAGKIGRRDAKRLWIKGFTQLALMEYAHDIAKIKTMTDEHLEKQFEAVKRLDKPLSKLPPVRNVDIKARMTAKAEEKAGV